MLLTERTGPLTYRIESFCLSDGCDWRGLPRSEAVRRLLERYVACLERYLEKHPYLWFNFFDFWAGEEGESAPQTTPIQRARP